MNQLSPVYTTNNICHDCYKCIRYCPCRAIRIVNGRAGVIQELCVACGMCVKVCPAKAKKIRLDLPRAKYLLGSGKRVYASLAPSYVSYFKQYSPGALIATMKKLGFSGVSETALGAQAVSVETGKYLEKAPPGIYFSSACPAVVDYIRKYAPKYVRNIVPVLSPLLSHAKLLRKELGNDINVVFFGPCPAKKNEADSHPDILELALTFNDLKDFWSSENIRPETFTEKEYGEMIPQAAEEGKIYAVEGGMNDTIRSDSGTVRFFTVSGLRNLERLLRDVPSPSEIGNCKIFVECLSCYGGCINGPTMPMENGGTLSSMVQIAKEYTGGNSLSRKIDLPIRESVFAAPCSDPEFSEEKIKTALASINKFTPSDELNCGGCGYFTCREFAKALLTDKAESSMCVSHLRQIAQRKSNALIKYIPAGVVIVDRHLKVVECNRRFAELFDDNTLVAFESCGLVGADIRLFVDFHGLFASVLNGGGELQRPHLVCDDKILNISIFTISPNQSIGAIVQNVTSIEMHREQVSEKARAVIQKNIVTCQRIARNLGEHMAETEILLREVAGTYGEIMPLNESPRKSFD